MPGAYTRKEVAKYQTKVLTGFETASVTLDGTVTTDTVELAGPASKITVQSTGNLVFDYTVSINGETFAAGAAGIAAGALSSYTTHIVSVVKVTRVSGTGKVVITGVG